MTKPVLLVRAHGNEGDAEALHSVGIQSVADPYLSIEPLGGQAGLDAANELLVGAEGLGAGDWVIATSLNGLRAWGMLAWQATGRSAVAEAFAAAASRGVRFAAIGAATADKYSQFGIHDVFVPSESYGQELAAQLIEQAGPGQHRALVPAGNLAMATLTDALGAAGWNVQSVVVYQTATVEAQPESVSGVSAGEFGAVLFRSPSAARAFVEWNLVAPGTAAAKLPVICGGKTTAAEARALGLNVAAVANDSSPAGIAAASLKALQESGAN